MEKGLDPADVLVGEVAVFDVGVEASALVGMIKPEPAIYDLACSRLEVLPQEALFIDDSHRNVQSARQFGLHALQYVGEETIAEAAELLGLPWGW